LRDVQHLGRVAEVRVYRQRFRISLLPQIDCSDFFHDVGAVRADSLLCSPCPLRIQNHFLMSTIPLGDDLSTRGDAWKASEQDF
jgi:hypothetical protein